jgi:V/A-type H+-transporting ATPase subunit K
MGVGLLGGEIKPVSMELGLICLAAGMASALGGLTAIGQGMTAGAAMGSVAKNPDALGQNMVLSVMSETFAVFALLIAILIMVGAGIM